MSFLALLAIAVAASWRRATLRQVLFALLVAIVAASYLYSIVVTSANGVEAFFSPLTRAWELAIGCLIGGWCGPPVVKRLPAGPLRIAVGLGGLGLAVWLAFS